MQTVYLPSASKKTQKGGLGPGNEEKVHMKGRRRETDDGVMGGEGDVIIVREKEREGEGGERRGGVANSVCDVGIDQSDREKGGT